MLKYLCFNYPDSYSHDIVARFSLAHLLMYLSLIQKQIFPTQNKIQLYGLSQIQIPLKGTQTMMMNSPSSSTSSEQTQHKSKLPKKSSNNIKKKKSSSQQSYNKQQQRRRKPRYTRKTPLSPTEKALRISRKKRHEEYETMRTKSLEMNQGPPSIWSFDSLFPAPVLDDESIREDLYGTKAREDELENYKRDKREIEMERRRQLDNLDKQEREYLAAAAAAASADASSKKIPRTGGGEGLIITKEEDIELTRQAIMKQDEEAESTSSFTNKENGEEKEDEELTVKISPLTKSESAVDRTLTQLVQDRLYGLTRSPDNTIQYSGSLLDSSRAVQFREGRRLGKALTINIDRLCHFAKKDLSHGRLEEAQEYYLQASNMDPTDGRPYLGLSRIAQRRGDLQHARGLLKEGISKSSGGYVVVKGPRSVSVVKKKKKNYSTTNKSDVDFQEEEGETIGTIPDLGPNPFLLQALGTLEEKMGNLYAAEELYLQALRSRPSHAAAWVALAQLRTKKLRQSATAGRGWL